MHQRLCFDSVGRRHATTKVSHWVEPGVAGVGEAVDSLKDSVGKGAAGDDVKDISTIAKVAGDEMAAATKSPEVEPTKQTAKKAKK